MLALTDLTTVSNMEPLKASPFAVEDVHNTLGRLEHPNSFSIHKGRVPAATSIHKTPVADQYPL